jgi:hypothetical protein
MKTKQKQTSSIRLQAVKPVQLKIKGVKPVSEAKIRTLMTKYKPEFDFILDCNEERILILLENSMAAIVGFADAQETVEVLRRQIKKPNLS